MKIKIIRILFFLVTLIILISFISTFKTNANEFFKNITKVDCSQCDEIDTCEENSTPTK